MRRAATALFTSILAAPASAGELILTVAIPRLDVSEYHRPYLAAWLEGADGRAVANLAIWYDVKKRDNEGVKWLKDMGSGGGLPPEKWSSLMYGFGPFGGSFYGTEEAYG